jgi:hypothetical protein
MGAQQLRLQVVLTNFALNRQLSCRLLDLSYWTMDQGSVKQRENNGRDGAITASRENVTEEAARPSGTVTSIHFPPILSLAG